MVWIFSAPLPDLSGILIHSLELFERAGFCVRSAGFGIVGMMTIDKRSRGLFHLLRSGEKLRSRAGTMPGSIRGKLDIVNGD